MPADLQKRAGTLFLSQLSVCLTVSVAWKFGAGSLTGPLLRYATKTIQKVKLSPALSNYLIKNTPSYYVAQDLLSCFPENGMGVGVQ